MSATETIEIPLGLEEDCDDCADRMQAGLRSHRGIEDVAPAGSGGALLVRYDPDLCSLTCVSDEARRLRVDLSASYEHAVLNVSGMDCYDCAQTIESAVCRMPGVTAASVNFPAARMRVEFDSSAVALDRVASKVEGLGYAVGLPTGETTPEPPWWRRREATTGSAAALLLLALVLDFLTALQPAAIGLYAGASIVGGWPIARSGFSAVRATRRPDINFLMSIAVVGAAFIGAWLEAALVVVLFSVGEALEGRAVARARRELAGLVALAPESARVRRDGTEVEVAVAELVVGDLVVVRPGERIPADGAVVEGASAVDQAPITGESTPVDKVAGDPLFAGTLNGQGLLVLSVTAAPGDTTIAKIGRLVEEAQARKSPSERWVDAFAKVYTPIVIVAAALVATVPLAFGVGFSTAFYSALALLILACPCALVISTPVSIVSALGRASAAGVLVKGGAHLERAALVTTVAFDKTGTLTLGKPEVAAVEPFDVSANELLTLAASLERGSEHPLAKAIVAAAVERGLDLADVSEFQALTGLGARGTVGGAQIAVGNPRLFDEVDPRATATVERLRAQGQTAVIVTRDGIAVGALGLADRSRPEAAEALAALGRLGITRTILLTGDNRATAEAIAREVGVAEVRAELMPEDKAAAIGELGPGVAMVGDGVNDAPALASAELGFAMGSAGSDTAIEVADIALMGDDPRKVAGLVGLARWTRSIVRQNIAFSLGTKALALGFLAAGALPLWAAVGVDVGASLIVVANGLRLLRGKPGGRLRGAPILQSAPARTAAVEPVPAKGKEEDCACC